MEGRAYEFLMPVINYINKLSFLIEEIVEHLIVYDNRIQLTIQL
jgi:hypothetical protein